MRRLLVLSVLLIVLVGSLAACGNNYEHDEALFGTWIWESNVNYKYIFNEDGTGQRGDADIQEFTWHTSEDLLVLEWGRGFIPDNWTYVINAEDYALTITRRGDAQETFTYFRIAHDPVLAGTWFAEEALVLQYEMNPDGTGTLTFDGDEDDFRWFTAGDRVIMHFGPLMQDDWSFSIDGEVLSLVSRQVTGLELDFLRPNFDPAVVGTWVWDMDETWEYVFNADGTGTRGFLPDRMPFLWLTSGDLLIMDLMGFAEHWDFVINGDILTIDSRQTAEIYSYLRR